MGNNFNTSTDSNELLNHVFYASTPSIPVIEFDDFSRDMYELDFGDKFQLEYKDKKYYAVRKKSKYPKTYEKCLNIIGDIYKENDVIGYREELLTQLQMLLLCRDTYWEIAGEEMGLGKTWEPDYDSGVNKYGIICMNGVVQKSNPTTNWERHLNKVLDFPTQEMRDAFYENFKELIEGCKELL